MAILGSTGSIGCSALRVVRNHRERLAVTGVAACRRVRELAEQAREFGCGWAATSDPERFEELRAAVPPGCKALCGLDAVTETLCGPDVDVVLAAIVGTAGLRPVLSAIRAGKDIALASKEILVAAGELVMAEAERCGSRILPVDSEHSALFQCLRGRDVSGVRRLILTASGGPFRTTPSAQFANITVADALRHPTWKMGRKVTVDSATMMNKALEFVEACRLFRVPPERVEVVVHPQSVIHSMVEFVDGSILAQMSEPDMCVPIQVALLWPERRAGHLARFDFGRARCLEFEPPNLERFPALRLARESVAAGGTMPTVLNAANEVAVDAFCEGRIGFAEIANTVETVMGRHRTVENPTLEQILDADRDARREADATIGNSGGNRG